MSSGGAVCPGGHIIRRSAHSLASCGKHIVLRDTQSAVGPHEDQPHSWGPANPTVLGLHGQGMPICRSRALSFSVQVLDGNSQLHGLYVWGSVSGMATFHFRTPSAQRFWHRFAPGSTAACRGRCGRRGDRQWLSGAVGSVPAETCLGLGLRKVRSCFPACAQERSLRQRQRGERGKPCHISGQPLAEPRCFWRPAMSRLDCCQRPAGEWQPLSMPCVL